MKNFLNKLGAGLSVLPVLLLPGLVHAQTSYTGLGSTGAGGTITSIGTQAGVTGTLTLPQLIGNIINVVLGTMGIVFVILIIYAGFLYMQAGTNPENAKKAKQLIINSVIGLIIIVAAYAIASFIITQIGAAASATT